MIPLGPPARRTVSPMRSILLALLAGALTTAAVACGAAPQHRAEAVQPPPSSDAPLGDPAALRARIDELDLAIAADWPGLDIEPPSDAMASEMASLTPAAATSTCERSSRTSCVDVCKLSDSICNNATTICDLAAQLPGDAWAADKCNRGKASCKTASERCCGCM